MKQSIFGFLVLLTHCAVSAQPSQPDTMQTNMGALVIHPVQHASLILTVHGITIYADPSGADYFKGMAAPDIILVTDIHGDHFDIKTIDTIKKTSTMLVVPQAVADKLPAADKDHLVVLKNGEQRMLSRISIEAIRCIICRKVRPPCTPKAGAMAMCSTWAASAYIFPGIRRVFRKCAR